MDSRDRFVDKFEAASLIGCSPRTLDKWAHAGIGPRYFKISRLRRYRVSDILDWLEAQPKHAGVDCGMKAA